MATRRKEIVMTSLSVSANRSAGEIASLIRVSCVLIRGETSVNSSPNVVWSIRKKFLKLGGSSVDNSFKRA
jgi:hypothetical protein